MMREKAFREDAEQGVNERPIGACLPGHRTAAS